MNDPVLLRQYVREIMAYGPPGRAWTERKIFEGVKRLARDPLSVDELHAALRWNEARDFIESRPDEDAATAGEETPTLWVMTATGRQREGLK